MKIWVIPFLEQDMKIWVITWSDNCDSGDCFEEAYDSEEAATKRCHELNQRSIALGRMYDTYDVVEYELNTPRGFA